MRRVTAAQASFSAMCKFYDVAPSGAGFQEFPQIGTLSVDFEVSTMIQASDGNLWTAFTTTSNGNGSVPSVVCIGGDGGGQPPHSTLQRKRASDH